MLRRISPFLLAIVAFAAAPPQPNPATRIPQRAALADAGQFFRTLRRAHPDLYGQISRERFDALVRQTNEGIAAHLDSRATISVADFASLIAYAAATLHDGHTTLDWHLNLDDSNTEGKRFPAFRLDSIDGRFFIAAAQDTSLAGSELIAVNGAPAAEFFRPILERCSGETAAFRAARFTWDDLYWYYLTDIFRSAPSYRIQIRDSAGREREAPLEILDFPGYVHFHDSPAGHVYLPNRQDTAVEFLDSGATAHLLYSHFTPSRAERKKLDAAFAEIQAKGSRNLIIDLRHNGGGDSGAGEYLFSYIYSGKFHVYSKLRAKTSIDAMHDVPWVFRPLAFILQGHVFSHHDPERIHRKPTAFFSGRTYLLTDNATYSMAVAFASMVRDYRAGTTLGYETGGRPITFWGPHHFVLKNSRIHCGVAWTQGYPPIPRPGDDEHGLIPDVPLTPAQLAPYQTQRDPVLAFTLHYIDTAQ